MLAVLASASLLLIPTATAQNIEKVVTDADTAAKGGIGNRLSAL